MTKICFSCATVLAISCASLIIQALPALANPDLLATPAVKQIAPVAPGESAPGAPAPGTPLETLPNQPGVGTVLPTPTNPAGQLDPELTPKPTPNPGPTFSTETNPGLDSPDSAKPLPSSQPK